MLVFQVLMTLMYLTYSGVITWSVVKTIVEWRYYGDMYCLTAPIFLLLLRLARLAAAHQTTIVHRHILANTLERGTWSSTS